MATPSGPESTSIAQQLRQQPYRFEFFQAVRILERLCRESAGNDPDRMRHPVGRDHVPAREVVRFRAHQSLSFPASSVVDVQESSRKKRGGGPLEMVVAFMGLTGSSGVLPLHYTRTVIEQIRERDSSLRDFFDLFNHRLISLFFRAWEKYRFPTVYERSHLDSTGKDEDLFTSILNCLVGLGTPGLRGQMLLHDESFLYYAGLFSSLHRPAISLKCMVSEFFAIPAEILQFQGQWLPLSRADRSGLFGSSPDANNILGVNTVLGERIWDVQSKFQVLLGPLFYHQYLEFIPSGQNLKALCQLVRTYVGLDFDFDVRLILKDSEIPPLQLDSRGEPGPCLGWNTWLISREATEDSRDPVFALKEV